MTTDVLHPFGLKTKILSLPELSRRAEKIRRSGGRLVLTNGCFDLLHLGHVRYLERARELGDCLAVAVNGDESVRALKGAGRPINSAADRAEVLAALACVDFVTVFSDVRVTKVIEAIRPAIYAKGGDYTKESLNAKELAALKAVDARVEILPLVPGKSTSGLLERLHQGQAMERLAIGILGSGKGSNCRAILEEIRDGKLEAEVRIVISDVADAGILAIGREFGVPTVFLAPGKWKTKLDPEAETELVRLLREAGVDLVVLAGFMRILKEPLLTAFAQRIINLHPSLLPKYPGREAWAQALAAGERVTGCTVHFVDAGIDTGEIIAQEEVPILPNDTAASLHARIQEAERKLYPAVIGRLAASAAYPRSDF